MQLSSLDDLSYRKRRHDTNVVSKRCCLKLQGVSRSFALAVGNHVSGTWLRGCSNYISTSSSPQSLLCAPPPQRSHIASSLPARFIFLQHLPLPLFLLSFLRRLCSAIINVTLWYQKWPFPESKNRRLLIKGGGNKFLLPKIGVFTIPWTTARSSSFIVFFFRFLLISKYSFINTWSDTRWNLTDWYSILTY